MHGDFALQLIDLFDDFLKLATSTRHPRILSYSLSLLRNLCDDYLPMSVKTEAFDPLKETDTDAFNETAIAANWYRNVVAFFRVAL